MKIVQFGNIHSPKDEKELKRFKAFRKAASNSYSYVFDEGRLANVVPAGLVFFVASLMAMAEGMAEEEMVKEMRGAYKAAECIVPEEYRERAREFWKRKRDFYAKGEE